MSMRDESLYRAFSWAIRTLRRERGFSQERLALEAGISRAHLCDLECGKRCPRLVTLFRIAQTLDMQFSALAMEIQRNYLRLTEGDRG